MTGTKSGRTPTRMHSSNNLDRYMSTSRSASQPSLLAAAHLLSLRTRVRGSRWAVRFVIPIAMCWLLLSTSNAVLSSSSTPETQEAGDGGGAVEAEPQERPLRDSAKSYGGCLRGRNDVSVDCLLEATPKFLQILERFGSFTTVSIQQVNHNLGMIREVYDRDARRFKSMRALLEFEESEGIHKPKGAIAKHSAAMGLLWLRRGLEFWVELFKQHATNPTNMHDETLTSYAHSVEPFHGMVARNGFLLSAKLAPDWSTLRREAMLAPNDAVLANDLTGWADALEPIITAMTKLQKEFDMEDPRKSI